MREIRTSGLEGGGAGNRSPYPYQRLGNKPLTLPPFAAGGLPLLPPREERAGRGGPFWLEWTALCKYEHPLSPTLSPARSGGEGVGWGQWPDAPHVIWE